MSNQITVFLEPAQLPSRQQDQATFDAFMATFMQLLPTFGAQFNAGIANFNAAAAGGAYSLPYIFTPGVVNGAFNTAASVNQSATTYMYVWNTLQNGQSVLPILQQFDTSSSTIKGQIRVVKMSDPSRWLIFNVTGRADSGQYQTIYGSVVAASDANPFSANDPIMLYFQRTGDKGQQGDVGVPGALVQLAAYTVSTPIAYIDYSSLFSDTYSKYVIEIEGVTCVTASTDVFYMRLAAGGTVDTASNYGAPAAEGGGFSPVTQFQFPGSISSAAGASNALTATVEICNARSTTRHKVIPVRGVIGGLSIVRVGTYMSVSPVSGFRLYFGASNISAGTIRVYGVKA